MSRSSVVRYPSLTAALSDKRSPLRVYLDSRFPNRAPIQSAYRISAGTLRVAAGEANPGTVGAAFDCTVRMVLDPTHVPTVPLLGFIDSPEHIAVIREVSELAGRAADCRTSAAPDDLLRACWALALCAEVYRIGMVAPGSPLALIQDDAFTATTLMGLATPAAIQQLRQLHEIAVDCLYPALPFPAARLSLGPTFDASRLCAADADAIVDGLLLETKTRLGAKNERTGNRSDVLPLEDLYQLLGYVLWDRSDKYAITSLGFYSGRYGHLTVWPLADFLTTLAGDSVDLAAEREVVWRLLGGR
jgi:hypothetical protein